MYHPRQDSNYHSFVFFFVHKLAGMKATIYRLYKLTNLHEEESLKEQTKHNVGYEN